MIKFILLISLSLCFNELEKISDYNIYKGDPHNLELSNEFIPYKLITPLFSDYSFKHRSIYIPKNKKIIYNSIDVFLFPVGTIISKTFYYPKNFNDLGKGISLKETRIMIHREDGWIALPYVWNDDESEAYLEITGSIEKANWIDYDGKMNSIDYIVPNMIQCKGCHTRDNKMIPIGPKARNINCDYNYGNEITNQLIKWDDLGFFSSNLPDSIPKIEAWNNTSSNIDLRARGWLDVNCAHCHHPKGSANNTGLLLEYEQNNRKALGIYKTPVAAGRGSGHLKYDIVPGAPEESIMVYRFDSTDPGIMMPELGRTMIHKEGLELIKEWILSLER